MDKIMSARVDESTVNQIGVLSKKLNITRKAVIENAIKNYAQQVECDKELDILKITCGSWKRKEPASETVRNIKKAMRNSQERYKKP
ncbi:MAG: hypothetical protein PVG39_19680 [Desulfobacteraceae bacterium]|jgi:hypothetical protein